MIKTFEQFTSAVNAIMKQNYGLEPGDFNTAPMYHSFEKGEMPQEYTKWLAKKYNLIKINQIKLSLIKS